MTPLIEPIFPGLLLTLSLLLGLGLSACLVAGTCWLLRRQRRLERQLLAAEGESERLSEALRTLLRCEQGMAERLRASETQIAELVRRQRQMMNADRDSLAVEHIKKLLKRGSSIEEVLGASELSTTELELLASMTRATALDGGNASVVERGLRV